MTTMACLLCAAILLPIHRPLVKGWDRRSAICEGGGFENSHEGQIIWWLKPRILLGVVCPVSFVFRSQNHHLAPYSILPSTSGYSLSVIVRIKWLITTD